MSDSHNRFLDSKLKYFVYVIAGAAYVCFIWPFINNVVFDSVIHYAFAEKFYQGLPFQYNLHDSKVIASTSPFWTILLIMFFAISGYKFIILLKVFILLTWVCTTRLFYLICRDVWKFTRYQILAAILFWMLSVSVLKNSLGGMENIMSAFQLLLTFYLLFKFRGNLNVKRVFSIGLLTGWALLTRPEVGALCTFLVLFFLIVLWANRKITGFGLCKNVLILVVCSLIILLPWYVYQYNQTGKLLSDSALSRMYEGRWNSVSVMNLIYFHPFLLRALLTAFLPFTIGVLISLKSLRKGLVELRKNCALYLFEKFERVNTLLILLFGCVCYSIVVGGNQIGRYFVPFYPFLFGLGIIGLNVVYSKLNKGGNLRKRIFVALIILFLMAANGYDFYERVIVGSQMESNITEILEAPSKRKVSTSEYLRRFGFNDFDTISVAVIEVQFRYYEDDRINIQSLDGVSSPKVLKYMNAYGFPDFEKFVRNEHPDVIEVAGWSEFVRDRLPFYTYKLRNNLLSSWEDKISTMKIGDSFIWEGKTIYYLYPEHLKIVWK